MTGCKVRGSDEYLQGTAPHTVQFHSAEYDTGGFWYPASVPADHVAIPSSGIYLLVAYAQWPAGDGTRSIAIARNGLPLLGAEQRVSVRASEAKLCAVCTQVLTAGDQIGVELHMTHESDRGVGQIQTLSVTKLD